MNFSKIFFTISLCTVAISAYANTNVKDSQYIPKTSVVSSNSDDLAKVGYGFGYMMGDGNKDTANDLNLDAYFQGFRDAYLGNKPAMNEDEIKKVLINYQKRKEAEYAKQLEQTAKNNLAKGNQYLADNAKKTGVITTKSGLQYKIIKQGTGKKPALKDTVKVHYEGKLIDGTVFDSSYKRGEPTDLSLDSVIDGWKEGIGLMNVGSKYQLFIPAKLGYGESGMSDIEPNSVLIFDVELLDIVPKKLTKQAK